MSDCTQMVQSINKVNIECHTKLFNKSMITSTNRNSLIIPTTLLSCLNFFSTMSHKYDVTRKGLSFVLKMHDVVTGNNLI